MKYIMVYNKHHKSYAASWQIRRSNSAIWQITLVLVSDSSSRNRKLFSTPLWLLANPVDCISHYRRQTAKV